MTLLPQRGALAGTAARQQQGTRRALTEAGGEQRGAAHLVSDDLPDLAALEGDITGADRRLLVVVRRVERHRVLVEEVQTHQVGVRQPQHDAVVGVHDLGVHPVPLGEAGAEGQRPRRVHLGAERGVDDDTPVTQVVPEPLHEDRAVVGDMTAGAALLVQIRQNVVRRPGVEAGGQQPQPAVLRGQRADLAQERPHRAAQFERAAQLVALPERQPARHSGGGGDQHLVAGDVLDPPRGRAECEDVADPRLVHHLLVQLAHPAAALAALAVTGTGTGGTGEEHTEQTAVGDRAARGDGEALRTGAARDRTRHTVPHHTGAQLGERVGRIAAREHVEDGGERGLGERGERRRAAGERQQVVGLPGVERDGRDELLRQHVQRIGRDPQRLDGAGAHPLGDDGGLHQIAPVLREDDARGDGAHLVARTAHPLETGGHRRR